MVSDRDLDSCKKPWLEGNVGADINVRYACRFDQYPVGSRVQAKDTQAGRMEGMKNI